MKNTNDSAAPEGLPASACSLLHEALTCLESRAAERDSESERSMARCVAGFNGITGLAITEEQGWLFMACLKMARAQNGPGRKRDDYVDGAAYFALAGESVLSANAKVSQSETKPTTTEYQ